MKASNQRRVISWVGIVICLVAGCSGETSPRDDRSVYDFRLESLSRERFYFNQHRGEVILLVFWSTFCRQCKKELNALNPLHKRYASERFFMAAVCTDPENAGAVKRIVSGLKIDYPILLDSSARLFQRYGFEALPATVVIGPDGKVALSRVGYDRNIHQHIESKIKSLLDGGQRL